MRKKLLDWKDLYLITDLFAQAVSDEYDIAYEDLSVCDLLEWYQRKIKEA